jgi:hypothetical protein
MAKFEELTATRAIDPAIVQCIPRELFESIPGMEPEMIDNIYRHAAEIMTIPVVDESGFVVARQPSNNVWVAVWTTELHHVKGFLWCEFDPIMRCTFIQACAVDKEYHSSRGEVLKAMIAYVNTLPISDEVKGHILIATTRPAAFEKVGLVKSKRILMELKNEPTEQGPANTSREERTDVFREPEPVLAL